MSTSSPRLAPEPPAMVRLLIERAERLAGRGRIAEAHALFATAIAADPTPAARIAFAVRLAAIDLPRAAEELETAWDESRRLGSPKFRALCCQNLSIVHRRLGNQPQTRQYQQLAIGAELEAQETAGDGGMSPDLLIDIAAAWSDAEDRDAVEALLAAAASRASDDGQRAAIAEHRGVIAARNKRTSAALRYLLQAHRLHREAGDDEGCAHSLVNLGHVLTSRRRLTEARRCFRRAARLFDQLGQREPSKCAIAFDRELAARTALSSVNPLWN